MYFHNLSCHPPKQLSIKHHSSQFGFDFRTTLLILHVPLQSMAILPDPETRSRYLGQLFVPPIEKSNAAPVEKSKLVLKLLESEGQAHAVERVLPYNHPLLNPIQVIGLHLHHALKERELEYS